MEDDLNDARCSINVIFTATSVALSELERIADREQKDLKVRVACRGGGCSGIMIDMYFTKFPPDDEFDIVFMQGNVEFLVDKKSALFLQGAQLDYGGGLLDRGFRWNLPNSTGGCGCGLSFSF